MWLNDEQVTETAITAYRTALLNSSPNHIVIDNLFNAAKLDTVISVLQQPQQWQTQQHTYSALYVDNAQWQQACDEQRFVQRDVWQREKSHHKNTADDFLSFLRGDIFMSFLSRIFNIELTDINVEDPLINTNYFRLSPTDFVRQHADDSPGREVCLLLYLNKGWKNNAGGELTFINDGDPPLRIPPLYNRCVLFDPFAKGSEHWVEALSDKHTEKYRYNVTSWYWSE